MDPLKTLYDNCNKKKDKIVSDLLNRTKNIVDNVPIGDDETMDIKVRWYKKGGHKWTDDDFNYYRIKPKVLNVIRDGLYGVEFTIFLNLQFKSNESREDKFLDIVDQWAIDNDIQYSFYDNGFYNIQAWTKTVKIDFVNVIKKMNESISKEEIVKSFAEYNIINYTDKVKEMIINIKKSLDKLKISYTGSNLSIQIKTKKNIFSIAAFNNNSIKILVFPIIKIEDESEDGSIILPEKSKLCNSVMDVIKFITQVEPRLLSEKVVKKINESNESVNFDYNLSFDEYYPGENKPSPIKFANIIKKVFDKYQLEYTYFGSSNFKVYNYKREGIYIDILINYYNNKKGIYFGVVGYENINGTPPKSNIILEKKCYNLREIMLSISKILPRKFAEKAVRKINNIK